MGNRGLLGTNGEITTYEHLSEGQSVSTSERLCLKGHPCHPEVAVALSAILSPQFRACWCKKPCIEVKWSIWGLKQTNDEYRKEEANDIGLNIGSVWHHHSTLTSCHLGFSLSQKMWLEVQDSKACYSRSRLGNKGVCISWIQNENCLILFLKLPDPFLSLTWLFSFFFFERIVWHCANYLIGGPATVSLKHRPAEMTPSQQTTPPIICTTCNCGAGTHDSGLLGGRRRQRKREMAAQNSVW